MTLQKLLFPPDSRDYTVSRGSEVVEVAVEGGKARRRSDYSNKPAKIDVKWIFNREEYQYFMAFYNTIIKKGSLPFLIDLIVNNPYVEEYEASVVSESLKINDPLGLSIVVQMQLEIVVSVDSNFDELIIFLYDQDDYLNILEQLANYGLLV